MIEHAWSIADGIIATVVVALLSYLFRDSIVDWWVRFRPSILTFSENRAVDLTKLQENLLSELLARQTVSRTSTHYGQFGKDEGSENFRGEGEGREKEEIDNKPRMYLTLWPATILKRHDLAAASLDLAVSGINALFDNSDRRVHAVLEAILDSRPGPRASKVISYRHSICGALLLRIACGWTPIAKEVLDAMLHDHWQNEDGGWKQCNRVLIESDTWGSAYALRFLDVSVNDRNLPEKLRRQASDALAKTIKYFNARWKMSKWKMPLSPTEDNAVVVFVELAPYLGAHDRELFDSVLTQIRQWAGPEGNLRDDYVASVSAVINEVKSLSIDAFRARLSYALFRAEGEVSVQSERLFRRATEALDTRPWPTDKKFWSADLAFLLDLAHVLSTSHPAAKETTDNVWGVQSFHKNLS